MALRLRAARIATIAGDHGALLPQKADFAGSGGVSSIARVRMNGKTSACLIREAGVSEANANLVSRAPPPNNFPPLITRLVGRASAAQFVRDLVLIARS